MHYMCNLCRVCNEIRTFLAEPEKLVENLTCLKGNELPAQTEGSVCLPMPLSLSFFFSFSFCLSLPLSLSASQTVSKLSPWGRLTCSSSGKHKHCMLQAKSDSMLVHPPPPPSSFPSAHCPPPSWPSNAVEEIEKVSFLLAA